MGNQTLTNAYGMIKDGNNAAEYATFHLLTNHISFENYLNSLWNTSDFWFYFWNSMIYTVPILLGTLIISVFAGYAFAKFQFPLRRFWMVIFIIVMMIPYQAMISPTYIVLNSIKLINTRWSIILPNIFTPFGCYLIYQFMRGIPDETIESAKLDGAGHLKILLYVVIPQVRNGIVSLAVLNFIDSWNMVEQPIMYQQGFPIFKIRVLVLHLYAVWYLLFRLCYCFCWERIIWLKVLKIQSLVKRQNNRYGGRYEKNKYELE
jgi:multiple sugar transport system permease protein